MIELSKCWLTDSCFKYKRNECPLQTKSSDFCLKLFKLDYLYNEALISDKQRLYVPLRLDADNKDKDAFIFLKNIESNIEDFVNKGRNLYIYSYTCGNGKSAWSLRLVQSYFNSIWYKCDMTCKALFISVPKFLLALKDNLSNKNDYAEHIKENVLNADIVIWDDFATKSSTEFEMENLLSILDTRINNNKSNIYTSNISPDDLYDRVGARIHSRVISMSDLVQFVGADKRGVLA